MTPRRKPVRWVQKDAAAPDRVGLHRPRSHTLELSLIHFPWATSLSGGIP
jgi:hypothetical protein